MKNIKFIPIAMVCICTIIHFEFTKIGIWAVTVSLILGIISLVDWETMIIPDSLNITLFCLAIVELLFLKSDLSFLSRTAGFFAVSVPMLLLTLAVSESFGGGDIKMAAVCGFMLGWQFIILAAFLSVLTGGSYAIYLLISGRGQKNTHFAFGPFLAFAVWMTLLCGKELIRWYFGFF